MVFFSLSFFLCCSCTVSSPAPTKYMQSRLNAKLHGLLAHSQRQSSTRFNQNDLHCKINQMSRHPGNKDAGAYSTCISCRLKWCLLDSSVTHQIFNLPTMDGLQTSTRPVLPLNEIHSECKRSSFLYHRSSPVTFQAFYQENER